MQRTSGNYLIKQVAGESYKAYVPSPLPPQPAIQLEMLSGLLEKAAAAVSELDSIAKSIPNTSLFIYMYVRKEALLSSQIEGTQSSLSDLILFEHKCKPQVSIDDVEEVSNYVKAMKHGLDRLNNGFPLCLRLLREIHSILLSGSRGSNKLPGEFRRSQNWIGGRRPGNALFVPPPVENLQDCLSSLENFLHNDTLPILIKAGLAHVQFETIHPFLDGNGRLGRLLIILLLIEGGIIAEPVLYLSLYFKENRETYYSLLQTVRNEGRWENWLTFFLNGILTASQQAIQSAHQINHLFSQDLAKIRELGRARFSCEQVLEYLKHLPQVSIKNLSEELAISSPTARSAVNHLVKLNVLKEISGKRRDKLYIYRNYIDLLEEGADPL